MTPEEFEENVRIITGDPNWSLPDDEDNNVSNPQSSPLVQPTQPLWKLRILVLSLVMMNSPSSVLNSLKR